MAASEVAEPPAPTAAETSKTPQSENGTAPADAPQKTEKKGTEPAKEAAQPANGEPKLSGAESKKRAKAEKAAKREREKAEKAAQMGQAGSSAPGGPQGAGKPDGASGQKQQGGPSQKDGKFQHRRANSQSAHMHPSPSRRRGSNAGVVKEKEPKKMNKEVGLFGHLYNQPRRDTIEGVSKEVHPAVSASGFQMSSYQVCGSNARCVAMSLAFKKAIQAYTTPINTSLARHLTSHYLSPQIDYLKSHRPISVSMGNAIRWLKDFIIHIDPDVPESVAKADICSAIDTFIRERITVASTAIATKAATKIKPNSTIITYAKSSVVEKTSLQAHAQGTPFRVIVVENRPSFESRNMARSLTAAGVNVTYTPYSGAAHAVQNADSALLGAHAMMANGRLYSRAGTAAVAMHAHMRDVPVIVCCEKVKFTDRVASDSIVSNELAPSEELVLDEDRVKNGEGAESWKEAQGSQLSNILYDVTPAEFISMVVTEDGYLPPSSVPVLHRLMTERDVRA